MVTYIDLCDSCVNLQTTNVVRVPIINKYGYACGEKEVIVKYCPFKYNGLKGIRKLITKCNEYSNTFLCSKCGTLNIFKTTFCKKCGIRFVRSYG